MKWKAIGQSIIGLSHLQSGKGCEDNIQYSVLQDINDNEVLVCCASDGAGSAKFAALASEFATTKTMETLTRIGIAGFYLSEKDVFTLVEDIYEGLALFARYQDTDISEYSCTLLGCYITKENAVFFQVGDGAIIRNVGNGFYTEIWWPQNGEYQNSTSFIVDDPQLSNLKILVLDEHINEVALFTDGLQMLALNMEEQNVHQPFFTDLFKFLSLADSQDKIDVLNKKLAEYLDSPLINQRTDDDKTLFLATRV